MCFLNKEDRLDQIKLEYRVLEGQIKMEEMCF